jgi:hypothetical protein
MILIGNMAPRVEEDSGANQHKLNDEGVENRGGRLQNKKIRFNVCAGIYIVLYQYLLSLDYAKRFLKF